ncbi:MAG: hypothetical protein GXO86_09970 [Chlorobi bacterium]|nr:hypothetical protein [Chlorobiota bacterium]
MIKKGSIYKFGSFTFRVSEYYLMKGNEELHLRPKTCQTLQYLIEHHGNLVKKDELIENVWSDTVVTENTLTQCIKEIREKLGDNSENPRFIKTIPRVGYKFIAPVKKIETQQDFPFQKSRHNATEGFRISKTAAGIIFSLVLVAFAIFFFLWNKEPKFNFSNRDWILISNFDNRTGEDVFEYALRTALEMELSESKYVNVVPKGRVMDILNLMKQDPGKRVDRELGREICLRDGNIQLLVSGNLYKIGNTYSISVELIEPVQNTIIKIFSEKVNDQQKILPVISRLAISIRRELGESMKSLPKVKGSYELVTTPSLKALNFYSKGYHYMNLFDFDRAQYFLKQAVQYDTTFAMGYALLGFAELWNSNLSKGKYNFAKAASLVNGLSEREKFFILGANAVYNLGDNKKGIEYYELLLDIYPDDFWGNENISRAYLWNGDFKQYRKYKKVCMKLRPNYFVNYSDNGLYALYQDGNIIQADLEFSHALELNPDFPFEFPYLSNAFLFWMNNELDSADNKMSDFLSFQINKLLPMSRITSRWFISRFYFYEEKFDEGIKLLHESIELSKQQPDSKLLPWSEMELALVYMEMGKTTQFESMIKSVIVNSVGIARVQALGWLAVHYAQTGKIASAIKLLDELKNENRMMPFGIMQPPLRNDLNRAKRAFTCQIEGEIALAEKDYTNAIKNFNEVIGLVPSSGIPALTALNPRIRWAALRSLAASYERKGEPDLAWEAYQRIIDEKILVITVPAASPVWIKTEMSLNKAMKENI